MAEEILGRLGEAVVALDDEGMKEQTARALEAGIAPLEVVEKGLAKGLRDGVKVMVGGAPVTQGWADKIGADGYGVDAADGVANVTWWPRLGRSISPSGISWAKALGFQFGGSWEGCALESRWMLTKLYIPWERGRSIEQRLRSWRAISRRGIGR